MAPTPKAPTLTTAAVAIAICFAVPLFAWLAVSLLTRARPFFPPGPDNAESLAGGFIATRLSPLLQGFDEVAFQALSRVCACGEHFVQAFGEAPQRAHFVRLQHMPAERVGLVDFDDAPELHNVDAWERPAQAVKVVKRLGCVETRRWPRS